jgi:hypothetical protein
LASSSRAACHSSRVPIFCSGISSPSVGFERSRTTRSHRRIGRYRDHELRLPATRKLIASIPEPQSPDGKKIVFSRFSAATGQRDLFTVNADGTGLSQVTDTPGIGEFTADWGTHPVTP